MGMPPDLGNHPWAWQTTCGGWGVEWEAEGGEPQGVGNLRGI